MLKKLLALLLAFTLVGGVVVAQDAEPANRPCEGALNTASDEENKGAHEKIPFWTEAAGR